MVQIQGRLARVEGVVAGHAQMLTDLRKAISRFEERMEAGFAVVDQRFAAVDRRFTVVEGLLATLDTRVDTRFAALEQKIDRRIDGLERVTRSLQNEMSSNFRWMVGIQFSILVTLVASLITR